jgi:hypothetical protein
VKTLFLNASPLREALECFVTLPLITSLHLLDVAASSKHGQFAEVLTAAPHSRLKYLHIQGKAVDLSPQDVHSLTTLPQLQMLTMNFVAPFCMHERYRTASALY